MLVRVPAHTRFCSCMAKTQAKLWICACTIMIVETTREMHGESHCPHNTKLRILNEQVPCNETGSGIVLAAAISCPVRVPQHPFQSKTPTRMLNQCLGKRAATDKYDSVPKHRRTLRPNPHRTRDATRNATQANGTCWCEWGCPHCTQARKNVPIYAHVVSRVLCGLGLRTLSKKNLVPSWSYVKLHQPYKIPEINLTWFAVPFATEQ